MSPLLVLLSLAALIAPTTSSSTPAAPPAAPPGPPPAAPHLSKITFSFVVAGTVATVCTQTMLDNLVALHVTDMTSIGLTANQIFFSCEAASVKFTGTITIPPGSTISPSQVQNVISARYASAAAATAFLSSLGLVVTQNPLVNGVTISFLPSCNCHSFVNGITSDSVGQDGCAKDQVHGLSGVQTICHPTDRPYIPHLDDGCPSDMYRCTLTYTAPTHPTCACDEFHNGAFAGMSNGLCQKNAAHGKAICYPRNYDGDKKIGGWEYYGCPSDAFRCS